MTSPPAVRALRILLLAGTVVLLAACSPEASRQRGQPGADVGNHSPNSPQPGSAPVPSYRTGG